MSSIVAFLGDQMTYAATSTATMVPNGDVTAGWPSTGGSNDGSCSGGTHCDFVDDGTTDKTSDYISTGSSTTGNEVEEYALTSPTNVSSASQIVLRVYAMSTTNANGGTLDTLTINLRVNGTLQTAVTTCTPAYNSWTACTATFTGSWVQSGVDSMQAYVQRVVKGSGNPSKQADTIQLANVYGTLTYTQSLSVTQSAYRWFGNQDVVGGTSFAEAYGGVITETGRSVVQTSDGGYAVAGYTHSHGAGDYDMFIAKHDPFGAISWIRTWGGSGYDYGYALVQTSDGGYAVTGTTSSYGTGGGDAFLVKYDSFGNLSWSKTWGGSNSDTGNALVQTSDGGYAVTGNTSSYGSGGYDMFIAKYDSSGNASWSKTWGGSGYDYGNALVQTSDGGYAVTGTTGSFGAGDTDILLVKYDASGNLLWNKTWGTTGTDSSTSLIQTSDGGYAVAGNGIISGFDSILVKFDGSGNFSWSRPWGTNGGSNANSLVQTSDGGYVVAGSASGYTNMSGKDILLVKTDASGNLLWNKTWGTSGDEYGYGLAQTSDGGYVVSGDTTKYDSPGNDSVLLVKFNKFGDIAGCGAACTSPSMPVTSPSATMSSPSVTISSPTISTLPISVTSDTTWVPTMNIAAPLSSVPVGSPLAAQDTATTAPGGGQIFRLRLDLHISGSQVDPSALNLKLQYGQTPASSCTSNPAPIYDDVTDSSVVRYADNPNAMSGLGLTTSANDPVHGTDTTVPQQYLEAGTSAFGNTNAISIGQDGMWDFALAAPGASPNTSYCFRVVNSDGSSLSGYSVYPRITIPVLTQGVSIVDASGAAVMSPNYPLSSLYTASSCQTTTGTFGTSGQRLRISGGSVGNGFSVSIAPTNGATALWSDTAGHFYDFNDSSGSPAGCNSGSDGDGYAGQLTINPSAASIAPQSGCSSTGLSLGSTAAGYVSGSTDSITLLSGSSSAQAGCYWDITGVGMSQKVPSSQPAGQYTLDMTVTMVAS